MDFSTLRKFDKLYPVAIQKYDTFSLDQDANVIEKMNRLIQFMNQIGKVSNDVIRNWNQVMEWVLKDGLNDYVVNEIEKMNAEGQFTEIFTELDTVFNDRINKVNEQLAQTSQDLEGRSINIKYPPAPLVGAKVDGITDDTEAIRSIIQYAEQNNGNILIPGISVITGELEFKKPMVVSGIGAGEGYGNKMVTRYVQKSGFLVKGNGARRVRTRRLYRASSSDPQDAPLSVALNIQAEGVVLRDFSVYLYVDGTNNSPTNYGADWDVGIFLGCRTHFKMENIHVVGYFRQAGYYFDVTYGNGMPRFNGLDGTPYSNNTQEVAGGDGCTMYKCLVIGAKWGIFVAGAIRKAGTTNADTVYYYDELGGQTYLDYRGRFGFSDFTMYSCNINGTDHHSYHRRDACSGNYLTDTAGGAMFIDGMAGNASGNLQGMRFFSCRFATWEPFKVKLDRSNRAQFYGCHFEYKSGDHILNPNGVPVDWKSFSDVYEYITATSNTDNILVVGGTTHEMRAGSQFIPSNVRVHNWFPSGTTTGSSTTDWVKAELFAAKSGRFQSEVGEVDIRSATVNDGIRMRVDSTTKFRYDPLELETILYDTTRPNVDNTQSLGRGDRRWGTIYAGTGTINTSDRNYKQQILSIDDNILDAWAEVNYSKFKFNDAVELKGDAEARWHIGVIAQDIEEAFIRHGLDAFEHGLLCYDEWEDIYEIGDEGNNVLIIPAGGRYSIRPDECLMLESALMRRKIEQLEALINP